MIRTLLFCLSLLWMPTIAFTWAGTVVAVHDGDTVTVEDAQGQRHKVRIYGVDAPELRQEYGQEARVMTARMVMGKTVEIIPAQKGKSHRREVAGIIMLDEMMVLQDALVSAGLAWVDDRYCKIQVCDLWRTHQADAERAEPPRGLWAGGNIIPPWKWRRMK